MGKSIDFFDEITGSITGRELAGDIGVWIEKVLSENVGDTGDDMCWEMASAIFSGVPSWFGSGIGGLLEREDDHERSGGEELLSIDDLWPRSSRPGSPWSDPLNNGVRIDSGIEEDLVALSLP
jgi:hypothetical protein